MIITNQNDNIIRGNVISYEMCQPYSVIPMRDVRELYGYSNSIQRIIKVSANSFTNSKQILLCF